MGDEPGAFAFVKAHRRIEWARVAAASDAARPVAWDDAEIAGARLSATLGDVLYGNVCELLEQPSEILEVEASAADAVALKALVLEQLAAQYLTHCQELLARRAARNNQQLAAASERLVTLHERFLGNKVRRRALRRERERLDDLIARYDASLALTRPDLHARLRRVDGELELRPAGEAEEEAKRKLKMADTARRLADVERRLDGLRPQPPPQRKLPPPLSRDSMNDEQDELEVQLRQAIVEQQRLVARQQELQRERERKLGQEELQEQQRWRQLEMQEQEQLLFLQNEKRLIEHKRKQESLLRQEQQLRSQQQLLQQQQDEQHRQQQQEQQQQRRQPEQQENQQALSQQENLQSQRTTLQDQAQQKPQQPTQGDSQEAREGKSATKPHRPEGAPLQATRSLTSQSPGSSAPHAQQASNAGAAHDELDAGLDVHSREALDEFPVEPDSLDGSLFPRAGLRASDAYAKEDEEERKRSDNESWKYYSDHALDSSLGADAAALLRTSSLSSPALALYRGAAKADESHESVRMDGDRGGVAGLALRDSSGLGSTVATAATADLSAVSAAVSIALTTTSEEKEGYVDDEGGLEAKLRDEEKVSGGDGAPSFSRRPDAGDYYEDDEDFVGALSPPRSAREGKESRERRELAQDDDAPGEGQLRVESGWDVSALREMYPEAAEASMVAAGGPRQRQQQQQQQQQQPASSRPPPARPSSARSRGGDDDKEGDGRVVFLGSASRGGAGRPDSARSRGDRPISARSRPESARSRASRASRGESKEGEYTVSPTTTLGQGSPSLGGSESIDMFVSDSGGEGGGAPLAARRRRRRRGGNAPSSVEEEDEEGGFESDSDGGAIRQRLRNRFDDDEEAGVVGRRARALLSPDDSLFSSEAPLSDSPRRAAADLGDDVIIVGEDSGPDSGPLSARAARLSGSLGSDSEGRFLATADTATTGTSREARRGLLLGSSGDDGSSDDDQEDSVLIGSMARCQACATGSAQ